MHGCNNYIGCLSVTASKIGRGLDIEAERLGGSIDVTASKIGRGLNIACSLVCTINKDAYLNVAPDYVWLTPDMLSGEFDIISNVSWNIV